MESFIAPSCLIRAGRVADAAALAELLIIEADRP
jgi:hypothetical protein